MVLRYFLVSKGHKTWWFDVFKSTKNEDGKWSEPENLRAPINTPDDDIFYVQSADGKEGMCLRLEKVILEKRIFIELILKELLPSL